MFWMRGKSRVRSLRSDAESVGGPSAENAGGRLPTPGSGTEAGLDSPALQLLSALARLCRRDEMDTGSVLAEAAQMLAAAAPAPGMGACRIDFMGAPYWSSPYREPERRLTQALTVTGADFGFITMGGWDDAETAAPAPQAQQFLIIAAELISLMLARRLDCERLEKEGAELRRRQAALEQIPRLAKLGGWEFDAKASACIWSEEARRIAGFSEGDDEESARREELLAAFLLKAIEEAAPTRKPIDQELPCIQPDGTMRWLRAIGEVEVAGAKLVRAFGIIGDVTDERDTRARLSRWADQDPLTGLANRRRLLGKLETALLKPGTGGALLLIDLDNFKDVNDIGGHDVGDALLRAFGQRLEQAAGKTAFVARLGGDEFVVFLPKGAEKTIIERWAGSLLAKMREPLPFSGRVESIRLSAGLTTYPADGGGAAELLKNADLALYAAKGRGRNTLVSYDSTLREESRRRVAICSEVKEALRADQIAPFYQPKICLRTGELVGFEALLRWEHPAGTRAPGAMLPAFELPELSRALCGRMLDRIISDLSAWQERRLRFGRVAFNASSSEFSGFDLVDRVLGQLQRRALAPSALGLEVTETVFLGGSSDAITSVLEELHAAGVEIALDDFGTGYASLTHLQQYPVDVIKIDRSFIDGLLTDSASQAITSVVLGLGRSLGMKVVAEGVENAEQVTCLRAAGCDQVQGYFFARPMPAAAVPDFISKWKATACDPLRSAGSMALAASA